MAWGASSPRREPVLRVPAASNHPGEPRVRASEPPLRDVLLTTTPAVEGRPVAAYLGVVTGESTFRTESEAPTGLLGRLRGRSKAAPSLAGCREEALRDLRARAAALGADAVLGLSLAHESLGDQVLVVATGTAVRLG
ncbi:heavy metal-binding domain-containing protein [Rubellimicrobium aerolatum]|uniref:Heavy metal-binding domain-containing protein n=1 Tax=Rubellimicrobium aerolatum TaxID=490979 RepID=A0ABW0S8H2_9RHOB|nr:heavy metal-binding domain-containing protein [Rubellimicrobium aerolatum]MBP1804233.1 uncharacterized protein YbjQ (UPF0145 family) [Rubellimicrobium aerolatum]